MSKPPNRPSRPLVHELRARPSIDDELDWFFNRAESDMSAPSNYQAALGRHGVPSHRTAEDAAEAAHRYRQIRSWLKAMQDSDAGVLQAAYEVRPWPAALYDELGRLTGIVVRLACALDAWPANRSAQQLLEMARAKWLLTSGAPCRSNTSLHRLRREAEVRFARAHHAYSVARGDGRSVAGLS